MTATAATAAAAEMSSVVFRTLLLFLATAVSVQGSAQLSCSPAWTLHGDRCYKLYTTLLSWQRALDVCRTDGAYLARIDDIYTNIRLGNLASRSSISNFWIGLNRLSVPDSNSTFSQWSDGSPSSVFQAFWDELQPALGAGDCGYVSQSQGQHRWALATCEWKRAFVCELAACPSGSFQCSTGGCVQASRTCDNIQDCSDGSDEINCPSLCKQHVQGTEGTILSANFPGGYAINSDCQWTIEGPLGSNIFLQVNVLDTEVDRDEVIVMGGGKTPSTSNNLQRMSGVNAPSAMIRSYNNFLIVRFYSDGAVQGAGFNLTWSAVQYSIPDAGQQVEASHLPSQLRAPLYPAPYLRTQETVWLIHSAADRSIVTLKREDIDLAPGDYIYVRDGSDASGPLLAEYSGTTGPLYVLSTGPSLYILVKTGRSTGVNHRGFAFTYVSGCQLSLTENKGEIFSPGYGVTNYANYVTCTYVIQPNSALRTTLRFDPQYDVEYQNDKLQVYVGQDSTGAAVHNELDGGFTGTTAPAPIIAGNGSLFVQFQTNAIDSRTGWKAVYSKSCPSPTFNPETICTPSCLRFDYGDAFNVSCPTGYVFDSLEFYTEQGGSSVESMAEVRMECLLGGSWNVRRYPQCVPRYCGQAPEITNGYVKSATGAVFGSTATYVCAEGYSTTASTTTTCQQNGTWETPPVCAGETCPSLTTSIAGGSSRLTEGNGVDAGSVYRFVCDSGYTLSGSPTVHCNATGQWSHPAPTCYKLRCLVPTIANGNIISGSGSFADYDSVLPVVCDTPAYVLVGNATIRCLADQSFTSLPECHDVNECNTQPCPANAECVNTAGSYECPCLPGFQKNGSLCSNVDECSDNNGGCSDTCTDTVGSYVCGCPVGYALYTQDGTEGYAIPEAETGLRVGESFYLNHTCVRNQCPTPVAPSNGYSTEVRTQYNYGDAVTFQCTHGYILSGQGTLQCQANGTWSADLPTCQVAKCPPDQIPADLLTAPLSVVPYREVEFGDTVLINCNVSGRGLFSKTRTCRFLPGQQLYSLQGDSYECGEVNCGDPLLPPGGLAIAPPAATTFGSTFLFTCDYMYDLHGSNNLGSNIITCAADHSWTFFNIACIKRQCPHPGLPAGGMVTFDGNGFDYYDNATFSCLRDGFAPNVNSVQCGVSEDGKSLSWGNFNTSLSCDDVAPPTFVDCPSSPVSVSRYSSAGFSVPSASDNSGSVSKVSVTPAYFYPTQPVAEDVTVTYTAVDHAGLSTQCIVSIVITDSTPPVLQCPEAQVLTVSSIQGGITVFDPTSANVTYNASEATLTFNPAAPFNFNYSDVGKSSVVDVTATDSAGNAASCQFQVVVRVAPCEPDTLHSANSRQQCVPTGAGGYSCTFSCLNGFQFYDSYPQEAFITTCQPGQDWTPSHVPSCVASAPVEYNVVMELQYQASPADPLPDDCQQRYTSALLILLQSSGGTLKQICIGQTTISAVKYNDGSLVPTYDNATMQLTHEFSVMLVSQSGPLLQYLQCYNSLLQELNTMASADSAVSGASSLASWKSLSPPGCASISVNGTQPLTSTDRTCASEYRRREANGVVVCLPCAPGTSKSSSGTCEPCGVGQYWVTDTAPLYGQCVDCSRGQATAGEGTIGAESCIELCEGNLVSETGVPPCRECEGNSFALNASVCQQCPNNTRALRTENPLSADCNTKRCTYNSTSNMQYLSTVVQAQTLTVSQCQDLCERWETLPSTSSSCVGFNYEKDLGLCLLYDRQAELEARLNYDFYERRCVQRDITECYCAPECASGYYSVTGYQPDCRPCPVAFFSPSAAATYCQECPAGQTTLGQAKTVCVADAAGVVCQNSPCQNNGNCSVLLHDAFCTCQPGYTGRYCEKAVDICASSPCYNGGVCTSAPPGFSCSCPSGFRGQRCEENIDDCAGELCNRRGTCVDGVNTFTCDCVDNYSGPRCDVQVQKGCDLFPCGNNSQCRPVSDYYRQCDCFPGYTGPTCDVDINECDTEPCQNGGTCVDKVNSFECQCRPNFTGSVCHRRAQYCATTTCGASDGCLEDPLTALPLCLCSSGSTQGEICQYSYRAYMDVDADSVLLEVQNASDSAQCRKLCDDRGNQCRAFVYELIQQSCRLYSHINGTVTLAPSSGIVASLSAKSCSYPREAYYYTEWFNTFLASLSGTDREMYSLIQQTGMRVCEDTDPVGVECRQINSQGAIPVGATCNLSGLLCALNGTSCPDLEIRFQCARSRVMEGRLCSVHEVCSEGNSCGSRGQCVTDPSDRKGYRCQCRPGFTGDLCQLTTDECVAQPCLNNGSCVDGHLTYTCNCLTGFEGDQCQTNPDDCANNMCDTAGTLQCQDGLGSYTCVCRPGYSGNNCSVNIDECASNPCFHGATCRDKVNGYSCDCQDGWSGPRCETIVDGCLAATAPCSFNGNCTTLFNDFACRCSPGTFGTQCENKPGISPCSFNNPCVNSLDCALSGSQAVCNCQDGTTGPGCELYSDNSCANTQCDNGAACKETASGPVCDCPDGYSGTMCEVNTDDCGVSSCPSAATCIDGVNEHFCRCPLGKALPDCVTDINEDYDMCFSPSLTEAGAALPYGLPVSALDGFTIILWVRFEEKGGTGTFLSVYTQSATSVTTQRTDLIQLDESGMQVNLFGNRTLSHSLFPINDGLWHLVVLFWNSASGDLDLTVDYLRQDKIQFYGVGQTISEYLWVALGGEKKKEEDTSPSTSPSFTSSSSSSSSSTSSSKEFRGCVSGMDVLSRGLDFVADLPSLQQDPSKYRGDVLRWAEFSDYGNTWFVRPSQARLVNCVANPSEPLCVDQSRDTPAPAVTSCPEDIIVDTIYSDAYASWTPPTFSGIGISVSASHQSGSLFQRGSTTVVYVAENQDGNTAVCSFHVFVGESSCPAQEPPRGGGVQDCQLQVDNFDACSVSCLAANSTLVADVPAYYSCGPSGAWATLQDHQGLYPTCGRIVGPARADVQLGLRYSISTGHCSTINQGIVTRTREELAGLLQAWGGQLCQSADCTDVTPAVNCSTLSQTRVTIALTDVSAMLTNGSSQLSVEDLWLTFVLDNGVFSFDTIIPGAELDHQLYSVQVTYICQEGQVVRGKMCVECGPGTVYNSITRECANCPVGQYVSGYAALSCTPCPGGQTTSTVGSTGLEQCAESCAAGQFYNGSGCALCPVSFYQNETGQFECRPCPRGYLTLGEGSTSATSCAEGCESGYELLVNGSCAPCSEGTYRQYGMDQTCQPCPPAYTTPTPASVSADNCTVLKCPAGSKANATVTGCELCPAGQYQPLVNQLTCDPCPVNFTTAQPGSTLDTECQQFCPSGYEVVSGQCKACPVSTFKDNTVNPLASCTPCPAEYMTASDSSTSISDCSIRNCSAGFFIQSDGQGVEMCAQCPVDQFNPLPYQRTCQRCPTGTGTRQAGADNETLCEAVCDSGEERTGNGTCTPCSQGSFKNNSEDRFGQCSLCPADFITPSSGATSLADCNIRNCSAGSYRDENNNSCVACALNTYQPDRWQTSCLDCPSERLTETTGATSEAHCLLSCSPGLQDDNGSCQPCPVGFYKNQNGSTSCSACPPDFRTAGVGSTNESDCSVAACHAGSYLQNATENVCVDCPYDQYQPDVWQDSCLPCPTGSTTFVQGASLLSQCLTDCPAGQELNVITDVCDPCPRGYYRDKSSFAQTACVACPQDFITAGSGSASASDCSVVNCTAPGRYLNVGNNACEECPMGTYNSQWWAQACTPCPSGFTTKTTGLPTADTCHRDCPSGQQVNEVTNVCSTCEKGTYRDKDLTWTCQSCPTPNTTATSGATAVSACNIPTCGPGYYYSAQQSACIVCPVGTYQSQSGTSSCDSCPDHKITLSTGRVARDDCVSLCQTIQNTCSFNAACSVDNSGSLQCNCNRNYQGNGYSCTHVCDLTEAYCLNGATCYKDRAAPCVCGDYYSGPRCEKRADPSKSTSDTEIIVGTVIGVVALLLILLLILIGICVRRRRARHIPDKESLSTSNSQSQAPSGIIPRTNLKNYHRSLNGDQKSNRSYDPAYYNAGEANRDLPFVPYDNVTFRE